MSEAVACGAGRWKVLLGGVILSVGVGAAVAQAGEADVLEVRVMSEAAGTWRFDATVAHGDTGWDHYADAWEVVAPDGKVLATRTLAHPHEAEQPFTRSLGGVFIPDDVDEVRLRAHDSTHGYGGAEVIVDLPRSPNDH